jgi:hypothetical protein
MERFLRYIGTRHAGRRATPGGSTAWGRGFAPGSNKAHKSAAKGQAAVEGTAAFLATGATESPRAAAAVPAGTDSMQTADEFSPQSA